MFHLYFVFMHNLHLLDNAQKYISITPQIDQLIPMSRRRCRRGRRGRFPKPVTIPTPSKVEQFIPQPRITAHSITIEQAEIEALRLVDLNGLSQEQAGTEMGVSRGTVWRLLQSARRKVAQALTEGRALAVTNEANYSVER
jgi:predicted DNA-binding protein (UPF0251 family)